MKSKRSPKIPPRNNTQPADGTPPTQPPTTSPAPAAVEVPVIPRAPVLSAPMMTSKPAAPVPEVKVPAAPLVSLAAALDAIHLEIPPAKTEPVPAPSVVKAAPTTSTPSPAPAPAKEIKVSEKPVSPPLVGPPAAKPPAPVASIPKKSVEAVAPLKPTPAPEIKIEKPLAPSPVTPVAPKVLEPVVSEPTKTEPHPITSKPEVAPEISEQKFLHDLPVLRQPEVRPAPKIKSAEAAPTPQPPTTVARQIKPMFVVMFTPELTPVAKVGGLGDVVLGLSRELELRGNAVEIILPKYDCMRYHHIQGLNKAYENLLVPWFGGVIHTTVWFGYVHGRKCFFIEPHSPDRFFNRGIYYGHADDVMRFAFFCRAAMEFLFKTGKQPDIIHCHDWQTALAPVLLWEMYQHLGMRHPRVCFTIHNFKHQGLTGEHILRASGLNRPEYFFSYDRMRDNQNPYALNLMKSGIVYSNFVTTVSPRHAWEAKDAGQAFGLEPTLHTHHQKYGGVLNGLDYDMFNPEKDPYIPRHFNGQSIDQKYENKRALRKRLWLAENEKPIIAFIGRLDPQKGPELVRHAIFYALNHGAQFVLLGESPDKSINEHFWGLKRHLNDNPDCHLEIGYSDELAHLIYAGADMMVVPSHFEPCGLTQLISLRYGTVPIVRAVGGLADTVFDKDHSPLPLHQRNGYVFPDPTNASMESALNRAIGCYYQFPDHFRHLIANGMNCDYSWNHPGQHYLNIYDYIREK